MERRTRALAIMNKGLEDYRLAEKQVLVLGSPLALSFLQLEYSSSSVVGGVRKPRRYVRYLLPVP